MVDCLQRIADLEMQPERRAATSTRWRSSIATNSTIGSRAVTTPQRGTPISARISSGPAPEAHQQDPPAALKGGEAARAGLPECSTSRRRQGAQQRPSCRPQWHALGLIYRDRLGDKNLPARWETFRMASRLQSPTTSTGTSSRREPRAARAARRHFVRSSRRRSI
jgi:hypothetical protein